MKDLGLNLKLLGSLPRSFSYWLLWFGYTMFGIGFTLGRGLDTFSLIVLLLIMPFLVIVRDQQRKENANNETPTP